MSFVNVQKVMSTFDATSEPTANVNETVN